MPRLFTAVVVSDQVRQRAVDLIEKLRPAAGEVKWLDASQMHITLKFIGEVAPERVDEIQDVVVSAARTMEPFEIEVAGAGAFPSSNRPSVLWLDVREGAESLDKLFRAIQRPLVKLRIPREERKYTPHLTLGRLKRGRRAPAELSEAIQTHREYLAGTSLVSEVVLFESQLLPAGPVYLPLTNSRLAGGDGTLP